MITVLILIVGLIALLFLIGLFSRKSYAVTREIIINKPKHDVFEYIRLLKNQDYYNLWVMKDPAMEKIFRGTDGTTGFVYGWNGNKQAGEGEQEITGIIGEERVNCEIRFKRPFAAVSHSYMELAAHAENQTVLEWGFSSTMNYPMNLMLLFMNMDKMLGKDVETSLNNLKKILEK